MAGIFPRSGVPPSTYNGGVALAIPPVPGCEARYYNEQCTLRVDPIALNRMISELVCVLNELDHRYDCTSPCNLATAVKTLQDVACRSELPPNTAWPPSNVFFRRLLIDDSTTPPGLWVWDCTQSLYRQIPSASASVPTVVCRSTLPASPWPPASNVGLLIIDDTTNPPGLWAWDCNDGLYRQVTTSAGSTGPCFVNGEYCVGTTIIGHREGHQISGGVPLPVGHLWTATPAVPMVLGCLDPPNFMPASYRLGYGTWMFCGVAGLSESVMDGTGQQKMIGIQVELWARVA